MYIRLVLLALCSVSTIAFANPSTDNQLPRAVVPLFTQPLVEPQSEWELANMREGCTVIAQGDTTKLEECRGLVSALGTWVRITKNELVYLQLMYRQLTDEDRLLHRETIEKNLERARKARQQLDKRYPFVRFYNTTIQWKV